MERSAATIAEIAAALHGAPSPAELRNGSVLLRAALIQLVLSVANASALTERLAAIAELAETTASNGRHHG